MSWLLAFLGFSVLIVLHELGHFVAAKAVGMRVERFMLFFPPILVKRKKGETEYGVGSIPLGGYVKITGMSPHEEIPPEIAHRAYFRQPVWKRIVVIGAGPVTNIVLAFVILVVLFLSVGDITPTTRVEKLAPQFPAAAVLQKGDRLIAINGVKGDKDALTAVVRKQQCPGGVKEGGCKAEKPVTVLLERKGQQKEFALVPVYDDKVNPPGMRIGIEFAFNSKPIGVGLAAQRSVEGMWFITHGTVDRVISIFDPEQRKQISGVVGAYESTRQAFNLNFTRAMQFLAVISLSLGIVNLFPFLPLDGGHIFWALSEKLFRRKIPYSVLEKAGFVGFILVVGFMVIGFTNDIGRLTGDGINIR